MADVKTIGEALLASVDRDSDRVAFITDAMRPSIAEVLQQSLGVRDLLRDRGARPGDRVVVWGDGAHPLEWMVSYFGVHLLGAWCVPSNPRMERATRSSSPAISSRRRCWRRSRSCGARFPTSGLERESPPSV